MRSRTFECVWALRLSHKGGGAGNQGLHVHGLRFYGSRLIVKMGKKGGIGGR